MEWSKDWGATTTWSWFALLGISSYLLIQGAITSEIWGIANGISTTFLGGKGVAKILKKNGTTENGGVK